MYHIVNVWMRVKDLLERIFVGDIDFVKVRSLPTDQFDAIDDLFGRVV